MFFPSPLGSKLARLGPLAPESGDICILLVEDSRTVRIRLRDTLHALPGVRVLEAETLAGARALLDEQADHFFCAVLDLTLPDADGSEIVDLVSRYEVPIIVLTGTLNPDVRRAVLEKRVIDYIIKSNTGAIEEVAYLIARLRQNLRTKVLVVDDSATFRTHLCGLLTQYHFLILTATNGREALERIADHPDIVLVLTDYHMPQMDGIELIREIRRRYRREDMAVIALSDADEPDLSAAMLKAGANDFLAKRFQTEEFFCRVTQNSNMIGYVRQLRDLATRDYLTGLYNRRHLFELGNTLHASARAGGDLHLALAMIDADHFKRINDQFGHDAGDAALKTLAATMQRMLPDTDLIARFGGEEFVCLSLLPRREDAAAHFEALRAAVKASDLRWQGERIPLSASIGFTTVLGESLAAMIARADEAVYRAKEGGRNRVVEG